MRRTQKNGEDCEEDEEEVLTKEAREHYLKHMCDHDACELHDGDDVVVF